MNTFYLDTPVVSVLYFLHYKCKLFILIFQDKHQIAKSNCIIEKRVKLIKKCHFSMIN